MLKSLSFIFPGIIALIFTTGCLNLSNSPESEDQNNQNDELLYKGAKVVASEDLPNCSSNEVGQLYYVLGESEFQYCDGSKYVTVDLKGDSGAQGAQGEAGKDGADGTDGTNGINGVDGEDGLSLNWLGTLDKAPSSPSLNTAYYNSLDGIAYIWDGANWKLLVKDGKDGENGNDGKDGTDGLPIIWKGSLESAPTSPDTNWAYYNSTDMVSYVYNGDKWDTLAVNGKDGLDGNDGTKGDSGVQGETGQDGINGTNGLSIIWKGSSDTAPAPADTNWAYFNKKDNIAYIFDGDIWDTLTVSGIDGANGEKGDKGDTGNQGVPGDKGTDGLDGISIIWKGASDTIPNPAHTNWAYFNNNDKIAYIWDGDKWDTLAISGTDGVKGDQGDTGNQGIPGVDGTDGLDGISIIWKGASDTIPNPTDTNWAYFNNIDKIAYIYDGNKWDTLAVSGTDGIKGDTGEKGDAGASINWLGSFKQKPASPDTNDVFYWEGIGVSCIYDGDSWKVFTKDGGIHTSACSSVFVDPRDDYMYKVVHIGDQVWFAEELKYLPQVDSVANGSESNGDTGRYYYVQNFTPNSSDSENEQVEKAKSQLVFFVTDTSIDTINYYEKYGVLYNWPAAMNNTSSSSTSPSGIQGACPEGWHIPSDDEWKELEMYLGMSQSEADAGVDRGTNEGDKLKSIEFSGTNDYSFNAVGPGYRSSGGSFQQFTHLVDYWTSTNTTFRELHEDKSTIFRASISGNAGHSVRCVKD
ncbi:MAG: hypothetical protein HQK83_05050 [Fibrobacteria bacterium]|nr:hypothetical protein [Fibrobacteria bacterium]